MEHQVNLSGARTPAQEQMNLSDGWQALLREMPLFFSTAGWPSH
jgi:hypothetical protein